jgi:hypothetical protein
MPWVSIVVSPTHRRHAPNEERSYIMQIDAMQSAKSSGTFKIGGDMPVVRLAYGAMRITGPGIWGPPRILTRPSGCFAGRSISA